jgi:hypothetical protein
MVEKESNTTPNMFFKHCAMLAIIILAKKKQFLLQIIKMERNFKLHFGAHLNAIYDMRCLYLSIGL